MAGKSSKFVIGMGILGAIAAYGYTAETIPNPEDDGLYLASAIVGFVAGAIAANIIKAAVAFIVVALLIIADVVGIGLGIFVRGAIYEGVKEANNPEQSVVSSSPKPVRQIVLKPEQVVVTDKFAGLGITVNMVKEGDNEGLVNIVAAAEGSPAEKAGLKASDLIYAIDNTRVVGLTLDQAVNKMKGTRGTEINLGIYRPSDNQYYSTVITRKNVRVVSNISTQNPDDILTKECRELFSEYWWRVDSLGHSAFASSEGSCGYGVNYSTLYEAQQIALSQCGNTNKCTVKWTHVPE